MKQKLKTFTGLALFVFFIAASMGLIDGLRFSQWAIN